MSAPIPEAQAVQEAYATLVQAKADTAARFAEERLAWQVWQTAKRRLQEAHDHQDDALRVLDELSDVP